MAEGSRMTDSFRFDFIESKSNGSPTTLISTTTKKKTKTISKPGVSKKTHRIQNVLEFGVLKECGRVELTLGLITVSEANCFEPWQKKASRHKDQHRQIALAMLQCKNDITLPCTITFIRYGIKPLDAHDNLPISNKYLADKIAEILTGKTKGKGDCDERLTWRYDQVKSKSKGVKIVFEF